MSIRIQVDRGVLTLSTRFGASLSYASSDGKFGAASSQILSNEMIDDDNELTILSDKSCNDGGCGYTRPGGVAYRTLSHPLLISTNKLTKS